MAVDPRLKEACSKKSELGIQIRGPLQPGLSGGDVFLVDFEWEKVRRLGVLKLTSDEKAEREIHGDKEARETWLKGFLPDHLIDLGSLTSTGGSRALLISLAKDRLENCETLRAAMEKSFPYARDRILFSVANAYRNQASEEWPSAKLRPLKECFQIPSQAELPKGWQARWTNNGLPTDQQVTITFDQQLEQWPNPIAFFLRDDLWPENGAAITVPWITSHGDLNARNVLCPTIQRATALEITMKNASPKKTLKHVSMIDMPFCRKAPFTYDVAFLVTWFDFLLPPFATHSDRDITIKAYRALIDEILTEKRPQNISAQGAKYVECVSVVFRQMLFAQSKMAEDIKLAFLTSLAAASLWQAIRVGSKDTLSGEARREVLRLCGLSALSLKEIVGGRLKDLARDDFRLFPEASSAGGSWTHGASEIAEVIADQMRRPNLLLVLGRQWREITKTPDEKDLPSVLAKPPEELLAIIDAQRSEDTSSLEAIGRLPLAAVFDWSVFPYPRFAIEPGLAAPRFARPIIGGEAEPAWNERDAVFYFHLRGSIQSRDTVAVRAPDRNRAREKLAPAITHFKDHRSADLTFLYVGVTESDLAETHEFLHRFWGDTVRYVCVTHDASPALMDYLQEWNIQRVDGDLKDFLTACEDIPKIDPAAFTSSAIHLLVADMARTPEGELLVKHGETLAVDVPDEDAKAFSRVGHLLSESDRAELSLVARDPREFFIGNRVEFSEIHQGLLVERKPFFRQYFDAVTTKLDARRLATATIPSRPGAGASTALRWLGYILAFERGIPTLVLSGGSSVTVAAVFEAIERLYRLVGRSFAVIADPQDISADSLQSVRMRCAPSRYPVLFLTSVRAVRSDAVSELELLKIELNFDEKKEFVQRLLSYCPSIDATRLFTSSTQSLFLLTLEAFGDEFTGVNKFVGNLLEDTEPTHAKLVATIAFFSHYAHRDCTNEFLQILTGNSNAAIIEGLAPFDQLLVLGTDEGWACRHDQLSKSILQYHLTNKFNEDEYRYELANFLCKLLDEIPEPEIGREIVAEYIWAVLNPQLEAERGPAGERPQQSRLIGGESGLPQNAMRYQVFAKAAALFPNEVNIVAHFGKYLSEREKKWGEAEEYLMKAYALDPKNEAIPHMIGKRYYDEVLDLLDAAPPRIRSAEATEKIDTLAANAHEWFEKARERNLSSEFGYTTPVQLNIRLIRDEFRKLGIRSATDNPNALVIDRVARLLSDSDSLVAEGQRYIEPAKETRRVFELARDTLYQLRGDLTTAIKCFEQHVRTQRGLTQARARVQLARLLLERAERSVRMGDLNKAQKDFTEGERQLYEVLQDPAQRFKNIKLWFDCARHVSHWKRPDFLQRLHQLHEHDPESLDARFLLMCLYFCEAVETGSSESWRRYQEFKSKSATRSANLAIRRYAREWLVEVSLDSAGTITKEYRVFPNHLFESVADREMPSGKPTADLRKRLRGRVSKVESATEGYISIEPMGFDIFFQPRVSDRPFYKSDAERRTEVTFLVQFTYEKPQAFSVQRSD